MKFFFPFAFTFLLWAVNAQTTDTEVVDAFYATLRMVRESVLGASDPLVSHDRQSFEFSFEPMVLKGAEMISIGPMGTIKKGVWTGAEQFYKLPTGGFVRLQEVDLAATGGKLYLNKGSVNADVHGAPASILTFRATDARRLEEILWTEGGRMVTLTYAPDPGQPFTAANHSALQLARSLTKR